MIITIVITMAAPRLRHDAAGPRVVGVALVEEDEGVEAALTEGRFVTYAIYIYIYIHTYI